MSEMEAAIETAFLAPLHERLALMIAGARITLGLDPEPRWAPTYADGNMGHIHPVAQARQDAFHLDISLSYPDRTGQQVKAELEAFLATLHPHPTVEGHFAREVEEILVRIEVGNLIRWNASLIWVLGGKVMEGRYEDMYGIRIRAWGLDACGAGMGTERMGR